MHYVPCTVLAAKVHETGGEGPLFFVSCLRAPIDETHRYSGLAHIGGNILLNNNYSCITTEREEAGIITVDCIYL